MTDEPWQRPNGARLQGATDSVAQFVNTLRIHWVCTERAFPLSNGISVSTLVRQCDVESGGTVFGRSQSRGGAVRCRRMRPKEIQNGVNVNRVKNDRLAGIPRIERYLASCVCDRVWIGGFVYEIQILYRPLKKGYEVAAERRRLFILWRLLES